MRFSGAVLACLCLIAGSAHAQARNIPGEAKAGELSHLQDMFVSINGVQVRLAPGVQIRDQANRLVVPTAVPPASQVRYVLDQEGLVRQVWILTPEEAQQPAANNKAGNNEAVNQ